MTRKKLNNQQVFDLFHDEFYDKAWDCVDSECVKCGKGGGIWFRVHDIDGYGYSLCANCDTAFSLDFDDPKSGEEEIKD